MKIHRAENRLRRMGTIITALLILIGAAIPLSFAKPPAYALNKSMGQNAVAMTLEQANTMKPAPKLEVPSGSILAKASGPLSPSS